MMFRKIQVLIYLMSLIQPPLSADSSFVLSVTEFKTKIFLTAFSNEIIFFFSADSEVPCDEYLFKF